MKVRIFFIQQASFKGQVWYAAPEQGPQVQLRGDMALADFRANSVRDSGEGLRFTEELLSWKALNVPGLQLNMNPGEATRVDVREVIAGAGVTLFPQTIATQDVLIG